MIRTRSRETAMGIVIMMLGCLAVPLVMPAVSAEPSETLITLSPLSDVRSYASVIQDEGKIYVIGGFVDVYGFTPALESVLIYDIATETTTTGANMPYGVSLADSALGADGKIYVMGGYNMTLGGYQKTTQIYDPALDEWTTGTAAPTPLGGEAAVGVSDGRIIVFGTDFYDVSNRTIIYDPVADSWSNGTDMLTHRWLTSAVVWNETAVILMGGDGSMVTGEVYNKTEIYNPVADTWSVAADMPMAASYGGAAIARNGFVYFVGGNNGIGLSGSAMNEIMYYDPIANEWSESTNSLPNPTTTAGFVSDSYGRLFLVGGSDGSTVFDQVVEMLTVDFAREAVTIVSPNAGDVVSGVVTVTVREFSWMVGFVTIELYVDGTLLGSSYAFGTNDFYWNTTGLPDGSAHTLLVRGFTWDNRVLEDSVTVTVSSRSVQERLADLENQLASQMAALEAAIADLEARLNDSDANLTALRAQADMLQMQLTALGLGLAAMGEGQAAAMANLNATLADLQTQLDHFQEQIDRVEDKADNGGMVGIATIALVVIVLVLLAMMFMASRKKP